MWLNPLSPVGLFCMESPSRVVSDNEPQLVSIFAPLSSIMGLKQLTTTAYQNQTNGQTDGYIRTILGIVPHYAAKNHSDWDKYVQVCKTSKLSTLRMTLDRSPPTLNIACTPTARTTSDARNPLSPVRLLVRFLWLFRTLQENRSKVLDNAQRKYWKYFGEKPCPITVRKVHLVFIYRSP